MAGNPPASRTLMPMDPFTRKMLHGSIAFAAVMLIMFVALTMVYLHERPQCSDQLVSEAISPDQQWAATVMDRRCGGDSFFLTHVNLRPATEPIRPGYFSGKAQEGEIFLIDQDAFSSGTTVQWTAPRQLTVRCSGCAASPATKAARRWHDVEITYDLR
ncbi:MAG TPA: hypothetical protein VN176_02605 [Verrucomicrobiae bacterium]|jgi:hypothetical protein|nr:hypothetical protein [Verrucomicrobiae bacterium]